MAVAVSYKVAAERCSFPNNLKKAFRDTVCDWAYTRRRLDYHK